MHRATPSQRGPGRPRMHTEPRKLLSAHIPEHMHQELAQAARVHDRTITEELIERLKKLNRGAHQK